MYAIIETGGKQYRVQPGELLRVEKLPGEVGGVVELTQIRLVQNEGGLTVGRPWVERARVKAEIVNAKKQIEDIEEEARKAGVPPGWLR